MRLPPFIQATHMYFQRIMDMEDAVKYIKKFEGVRGIQEMHERDIIVTIYKLGETLGYWRIPDEIKAKYYFGFEEQIIQKYMYLASHNIINVYDVREVLSEIPELNHVVELRGGRSVWLYIPESYMYIWTYARILNLKNLKEIAGINTITVDMGVREFLKYIYGYVPRPRSLIREYQIRVLGVIMGLMSKDITLLSELGYALGFFLGDGMYIRYRRKGARYYRFIGYCGKKHEIDFVKSIVSKFVPHAHIEYKVLRARRIVPLHEICSENNELRALHGIYNFELLNSLSMVSDLAPVFHGFILGIVQADGRVSRTNRHVVVVQSTKFIEQRPLVYENGYLIYNICRNIDIRSKMSVTLPHNVLNIYVYIDYDDYNKIKSQYKHLLAK